MPAIAETRGHAREVLGAAALAGTAAGIIDIGAAALINMAPVPLILRAVASGLVGPAAWGSS